MGHNNVDGPQGVQRSRIDQFQRLQVDFIKKITGRLHSKDCR